MATTSLNLLHLPLSHPPPSYPSRQLPHHLSLKSQINKSSLLVCNGKKNRCFNVEVEVDEDDDDAQDFYVDIFEKEVARAGIFREWWRRRFRETEKEERLRKSEERARFNARARARRWRTSPNLLH